MERRPIRSIGGFATTLTVFLAGHAVGQFVLASAYVSLFGLVSRLEAGGFVSDAEVRRLIDLEDVTGNVILVLLLATAIVWLVWEYRAQANLEDLGAQLAFSPRWAVGWWFVPFANLVQPFRVMRALWAESATDTAASTGAPLVGWWWAAMIAGNVAAWIVRSRVDDAGTFSSVRTALMVATAGTLLTAAAAVLAVFVIRGITARQALVRAPEAVPRAWGTAPPATGAPPARPDMTS